MAKTTRTNPGDMRHSITIEEPIRTTHANGERLPEDWRPLITIRAAIEPVRAEKYLVSGDQQRHRVTHIVRTHYVDALTTDCRLDLNGRRLAILERIDPDETRRELHLLCSEVTR